MSEHDDLHLALGSYLVGALDAQSRAEVEHHLRTCADCRAEVAELSVLPGLLARLTPEQFSAGIPGPPDDLLPDLLARARASRRTSQRHLRFWHGAAALAVAAALLVMAFPHSSVPSTAHYRLQTTASGAAGTVDLATMAWGTAITLSLRGLPARAECVAYVTDRNGRTQAIGTWGPTPNHDAVVELATALTSHSLERISIETAAGRTLLATSLVAS